jgi:Putative MetA-pathway of phenol degradation
MPRTRTRQGLATFAVVVLALGLLAARDAGATGPWVQSDNGYYVTARLGIFSSSRSFDFLGNEVDASSTLKYKDRSLQFDAEYGMSNRLTFLLGMPVQFRNLTVPSGNPNSFSNNGFGDIDFGLKYGFLDPTGNAAVALELSGHTPSGYNSQGFGQPPMGRGKFSALAAVHGGMTFDPAPVYVQGEVGYRKFTNDQVSDAIKFGAEAGVFATPRILIVGEYLAEKSRNKDKIYFQDISQIGGNVQYRLKPWLDVLAGLRMTVSGKSSVSETLPVFKGTQIRLGVSFKGNDQERFRGQGAYGFEASVFPNAKPRRLPDPVPVPDPVPAPSDTTTTPAPPSAPDTPK